MSTSEEDLKSGTFITRIPAHFPINFSDGNGPYKSLRAIKRSSPIYQSLKKTNLRRAQQIVEDKHIKKAEKMIATPRGTEFKRESVDAFTHATIGRIKNGSVTGVHFYDPKRVKLLEIIETNTETEVFKARIEFLNVKNGKWVVKKFPSTFFPKKWNLATLLMECKFAFEKIDKEETLDGKIKSSTRTNIEVMFVFKKGKSAWGSCLIKPSTPASKS